MEKLNQKKMNNECKCLENKVNMTLDKEGSKSTKPP